MKSKLVAELTVVGSCLLLSRVMGRENYVTDPILTALSISTASFLPGFSMEWFTMGGQRLALLGEGIWYNEL